MGQPLLISMGTVTIGSALILANPGTVKAESAAFYFNRGNKKSRAGNYYEAIADFNNVIKQYSNHPKIHEVYNNR